MTHLKHQVGGGGIEEGTGDKGRSRSQNSEGRLKGAMNGGGSPEQRGEVTVQTFFSDPP